MRRPKTAEEAFKQGCLHLPLTPHQKIMRAARKLTGLRLTASEVFRLSRDGAIAQCAKNDDDEAQSR